MKKLFITLLTLASFSACQQEPKIDYVIFSGKIENAKGKTLNITRGAFEQIIELNTNGTFTDSLNIAPGYYSLSHGRDYTTLYLAPGYNLSMSVNANEFDETIKYTGVGAENNNYLAKKILNNEAVQGNLSDYYAQEESDFVKTTEKNQNQLLTALSSLKDQEFIELEKKNLKYENFEILGRYETYHAHYGNVEGYKVSDGFIPKELEDLTFDNKNDYTMYSSYRSLAMNKVMTDVYEKIGADYQNATADHFSVLNNLKIPDLKNDIIRQQGSFLVSAGNPNMESLYNFFMTHLTDDTIKESLTAKFNKNKDLVRGKPSPEFNNYENHKGGNVSLSDLKGKYVYIDIWATWCGPCIAEIPSLKVVEKEFHKENIEFVSISIDSASDHDKWVAMVNNEALGGLQLFADNSWNSKFVKDYAIEGIPRFIFIDPNGNIVTADAPRPSNPKLKELFTEVLSAK
jgi:thiol-disulfide isomerase/thioredoxin